MISILAMLPMLFVDPLLGSFDAFKQAIESFDGDTLELQKQLKIKSWKLWIQEGPQNHTLCIHFIECEDPSCFHASFREAIAKKNSYALFLDHLFTHYLSPNYSLKRPSLNLEKVLDLKIDENQASSSYDFCYALSLLPGQLENHKEYCRLAMNEKKESTIAACKAFKMLCMKKWIQEGKYVLYYQKMSISPEKARESFLTLKDNPKAREATQTLREQTGLTFEELCPKVKCISLL